MAQVNFIEVAALAVGDTLEVTTDYNVSFIVKKLPDPRLFQITETRHGATDTWVGWLEIDEVRVGQPLVIGSNDPKHVGKLHTMRVASITYPADAAA